MRPALIFLAMDASSSATIGKQDCAHTPFAVPQEVTVSTMEATVEKRDNSQLLLSPQREGILRGGEIVRLQNRFTATANTSGTEISD